MTTSTPTLLSERLILRKIQPADLGNIFSGLSDPEVIQYYGISFKSLEDTKEQMKWFSELEESQTGLWWAVCSKEDGKFLGAGGFNNLQKEHRKAEIGFWLLKQFWGKGIMQEAIPVMCKYAFETLNLHRIEAFVETENVNSLKTLKRLGFTSEGVMKDCEIKNGQFINLAIFALFSSRELRV